MLAYLLGFVSCLWIASGVIGWWLFKRYMLRYFELTPGPGSPKERWARERWHGDNLAALARCVALPPLFLWALIDCLLYPGEGHRAPK